MKDNENSEFDVIKLAAEQLNSSLSFQTSKGLFEIGRNFLSNRQFPMAIGVFERVIEIGDSFFKSQAIVSLLEAYRSLRRDDEETKLYEAIVELPPESKRFIDPILLGVALSRVGQTERAIQVYRDFGKKYGHNLAVQGNLAELLLVTGDYAGCIKLAAGLAVGPDLANQIIGHLLQGSARYFMGDMEAAAAEFSWIGNFLMSLGGIPNTFNWDFRESRAVLQKIKSEREALVIATLDRRMAFPTFTARWMALNPPLPAAQASGAEGS